MTTLTPEQEKRLPEFNEMWQNMAFTEQAIDKEKAIAACKLAYEVKGLPVPPDNMFIFADGILEGARIATALENDTFTSKDALNENSEIKPDIYYNVIWGNMEAPWAAFYTIYADAYPEVAEKLRGCIEVVKHCGACWFFDGACVISQRPEFFRFDENMRLHNEFGPAIGYKDGYEIYSWHGTVIPKEWIVDKSSITPQIALHHPNVEERRAACEILGWAAILNMLDAKVIDEDPDPQIGKLMVADIPDIGEEQFILVRCGTDREFALPVPPNMKTALEAQAWMWDIDPKDYIKPEVRT